MIDVLFFVFLTIFFIFKLKNVLGTRNEDAEVRQRTIDEFLKKKQQPVQSGTPTSTGAQIIDITGELNSKDSKNFDLGFDISTNVKNALVRISFDKKNFLGGVEAAIEMINEAFCSRDVETLRNLLATNLFTKFYRQIEDISKKGKKLNCSIISFKTNELESIRVYDGNILAEVNLEMEQINFIEDGDGKVVQGSKKKIEKIKEMWTFERPENSKDNFWIVKNIANVK